MSLSSLQVWWLAFFDWVWTTSLASLGLIALVWLVQMSLGKRLPTRGRYALWMLVVFRLLMPAVPSSGFSLANLSGALTVSPRHSLSFLALPATMDRPEGPALPPRPTNEEAASFVSAGSAGVATPTPSNLRRVVGRASLVWLLGNACYLGLALIQHRRLSSRLRHMAPVTTPRLDNAVQCAKGILGLRREITVLATDRLPVAVFGFLRPKLLLSKTVLEHLSDAELRLMLLHELVHVQRRDVLLNWLLILVQGLHWFNPFVWLAFKRLRAERELVCDAAVLRRLGAGERHAYGALLIRMLDSLSHDSVAPSLVPMLNRQPQIHRRITMIAHFKPAGRLAVFGSTLLVLILGAFTFTTAAEKAPPESAPPAERSIDQDLKARQRGLQTLEEELAKQESLVRQKQDAVDALRAKLQIADTEELPQARGGVESEGLRRLEALRIETQAECRRAETLLEALGGLSRSQLRRALLTVVPDAPLGALLEHHATTEQKLAELNNTFGPDHPEVKSTIKVLATMDKQVDERLDGILLGLKTRAAGEKARLESLRLEVEKTRKTDLEAALQRRPYYQAKRDLETLQFMREKLAMRIMQERVDAAIAP